ncbi:GDSL-type esterase/lipase family protein [Actinomadura rudentiformis]|nr:GDSL-type esterase/lipase family protein [Actinomadura rudentiformis]
MRTPQAAITMLVVLCGLLVAPDSAFAATGSAACTEGGVTWRVDYNTADGPYGTVATVAGLKRIDASGESDAGSQQWELRWDNLPGEWPPPGQSGLMGPHHQLKGNLAAIDDQPVATYLSPRLVTPDGACQVYLAPFANRRGTGSWPRVPVLGDSLLQSLNDNSYNQNAIQGYVEGNLNDIGIRTEVEGQGGRRWTPAKDTAGLAKADSYLLDEFRGLLEHDTDGFVVALGANDALYIATAPDDQRAARLEEVRNALIEVVREMSARTGCLVAVTAPEHANTYDPDYPAAALELNNVLRWIAASNATDSMELVDFATRAKTHRKNDPAPWFDSDDLHLNMAGRLVYTATMSEAARKCADSSVLYGASGTFDGGELAGKAWLPSGQRLRAQAVRGWDFEPGKSSYFSTQASDGTIFISNMSQTANPVFVTGNSMVLSAFHPEDNTFSNIRIKTDRGKETMVDSAGKPLGFDIGEAEALPGGDAVAFTGGTPYEGQDVETQGMWPVFGILTKGPNGWRVASGSGWQNQWSPRELFAASAPGPGDKACPLNDPGVRDCLAFVEMAVFPDSKDVVVAQYFGHSGHNAGQITVLDLDGPDASGRYRLKVADVYQLPDVADPADPAKKVYVSGREVQTDPTGRAGNERFALSMDVHGDIGSPLIEFAYDRDAAVGSKIKVVSPPMLPGDLTAARDDGLKRFHGFGKPMYDHNGNLWGAHGDGLQGGPISVYAGPRCAYDGQPLNSYVERATGVKPAWGKICKAHHAILAPTSLGVVWSVQENPQKDTVVITTFGGVMYAIRPSGRGADMTFEISNTLTSKAQQLLARQATWPCPTEKEPDKTCTGNPIIITARGGPVSADGRAWIAVEQLRPRDKTGQMEEVEQWMYSVDVSRLFGREPVRLTARTGQTSHVHAELNQTFATVKRPGRYATNDVDSAASMLGCQERQVWGGTACTDPVGGLTGGFALGDETGGGVPAGTSVEYRVVVPKAGTYQVAYRATDRAAAGDQQIQISVDGTARGTTTIPSNDAFQTVTGPTLALPEGKHTIRLSAPDGHHGWQLDWTAFTRR